MSWTMTEMSGSAETRQFPTELIALRERIQDQPAGVRAELEPLINEVMEHAMFRDRVMLIAREALQRYRLDLVSLQFDLEATRREQTSV